jgi:peptidoglycan-N-acetylglucosamine deacetylase
MWEWIRSTVTLVAGRVMQTGVRRFLAGGAALVAVAAAAFVIVVGSAGASGAPVGPLAVLSASLTQDGQDLVWQIELAAPFSPGALAQDHRSLCLLIESAASGSVASRVCLAGPARGGRTPRLLYALAGPGGFGPGRAVAATVTRSNNRELSASFLPVAVGLSYRSLRWQVLSGIAVPGCGPAAPRGGGCVTLVPVAPSLLRLHTPRLVGCVASGPEQVFQGPRNVREVALTFDDGPWWSPPASAFVRVLARLHAPATFFEIGRQIPEYDPHGTIEREMLADGDMIGDHTWSHPLGLVGLSPAEQRSQLSLAAAAIKKATGFQPCLFRAPGGIVDAELLGLARSMGFATIQWDVDPRDWALPGVNAIVDNVVANAHNGAIVEEHFGGGPRYETLDALPAEIAALRARGYQLVTLTQMLGYKLVYR